MEHFGFILAAYLATATVLGGLILWVMADARAQNRALADLDRIGIRRGEGGRE